MASCSCYACRQAGRRAGGLLGWAVYAAVPDATRRRLLGRQVVSIHNYLSRPLLIFGRNTRLTWHHSSPRPWRRAAHFLQTCSTGEAAAWPGAVQVRAGPRHTACRLPPCHRRCLAALPPHDHSPQTCETPRSSSLSKQDRMCVRTSSERRRMEASLTRSSAPIFDKIPRSHQVLQRCPKTRSVLPGKAPSCARACSRVGRKFPPPIEPATV
jgi:hypothetical protein